MYSFMYRLAVLLGLGLGCAAGAWAQEAPVQFGKVTAKDFSAAADTSVAAVIHCDVGRSRVEGGKNGFQVTFVRNTRIQILRKAGYKWATVEVPLYRNHNGEERLREIRGFTYNLVDGQLVKEKMAPQAVFKDKVDANHAYYRFTLPNVREGSIIEFSYTINSEFLFNLQDWQFQYTIPVRWSEYQTIIPGYFRYKQLTRGYLRANPHEEKIVPYSTRLTWPREGLAPQDEVSISTQAISERWVMQNVPAFREEPFLTTPHDYIASVSFELNSIQYPNQREQDVTGTWEQINADLNKHEHFGDLLRHSPLAGQAQLLAAQYPTDTLQRAKAVLALVQRTVRSSHDTGLLADNTLRQVIEQHQGNVAEINLLLVQVLREAGLPANPVLLSTRGHGQILLDLPLLSQFNYVVAQVALPGQPDALLDATEPLAPLGTLPERCLNGQGRLIANVPSQGRWVSLKPAQRYSQLTSAKLVLDERGGLRGTAHFEQGGYAGLHARAELLESKPQGYVAQLQQQHPEWVVSQPVFQHQTDLDQPLMLDLALQVPGGEEPARTLYLNPLRQFGETQNPFRSEDRQYPVSFGTTREQTSVITLTLPAGYEVQETPAPLALALPDGGGRYLYQVSQLTPQSVQFTSRLQLSKAQYTSVDYAALRELYQRMVAKSAEMLVLHRK